MTGTRSIRLLLCLPLLAAAPALADGVLSPHYDTADSILIVKSERKLHLLRRGRILRSFDIALGLMPEGPKRREGDFRTPEGRYRLEAKNPNSDYFLSLKISYPNVEDIARAKAEGVDPGGQIMIHGQPNEPRYPESRYLETDWTDGCIAVSNAEMEDIFRLVPVGTPISIMP